MNPRVARRTLPLAAVAAGLLSSLLGLHTAQADGPPPTATRPATTPAAKTTPARAVDAIIADSIKAMGGADALGKHRALRVKMSITFQGLGISGTSEHLATIGDKALTITNIPGVASTREGSDGSRTWSQDPINGLRLLSGVEAEQARIEAAWNGELRLKELFPKIEATNEAGPDGASLECLVMTPKLGAARTRCFDGKTHLMVSERGVSAGPQGDTPFVARATDWRPVGDMKMPFHTEMQVGPLAFVEVVTATELDGALDASVFAVPQPSAPDGAGGGAGKGEAPGKPKASVTKPATKPARAKPDAAPAKAAAPPSTK